MMTSIETLVSFLANDPLTVNQVITQVGDVIEDYGGNVLLTPRDPQFSEANLVRRVNLTTLEPADEVAHLELTPAEVPTLESLATAFGDYSMVPAEDKGMLPLAIFYLDRPGRPVNIALIAEVKNDLVRRITLRRDPRI